MTAITPKPTTAPAPTSTRHRRRVDLEDLVRWAIQVQRADCDDIALHDLEAAADGGEPHGWSRDGVASLMQRGTVGAGLMAKAKATEAENILAAFSESQAACA